jgi:cytoskeleton protein RodZ
MNTTSTTMMDQDRQPTGAARIGMEMRLVRERLGWRLPDIASELRIRLPYLEAIERGDLAALPGAAYQTGFVRTYSQALGLDGDEILRRFRAEGTSFVQKAELSFLAPVPDRAVPTGAIVLLGIVLVLVGYGVWYRHTAQEAQLAAQIPPVPTELAPLAVPPKPATLPPASKPVAAPTQTATVANPPAAALPVATPAPQQTATATPNPPGTATTLPAPPPLAPNAATTATTNAAAPATAAATPAAAQKTIEATGDSWVQVQDSKGSILFSKTLHAGDSWPVPDLPGLIMTAGNAGNTVIADNGTPGAPLGAAGTVVRKYALTAPAPGTPDPAATPAAPSPATSPHAQITRPAPATTQANRASPASALPTMITPSSNPPIASGPVEGPSPSSPSGTN